MESKLKRSFLLEELCEKLAVKLNDIELLDRALTHTSYAHEAKVVPKPKHNERLEFLGDAVLSMAVCGYIYKKFPEMPEGEMSKLRSKIVCESALAKYARRLSLGDYILLGRGEDASGGKNRSSVLADALEAVLGACYIDQGWETVERLVVHLAGQDMDSPAALGEEFDFKTRLQEVTQKDNSACVSYALVAESGPGHNKTFTMAVLINDKTVASADGSSKKEAEQIAARRALTLMGEL